ncbi:uncharacterized protein LOC130678743 [Microplitis mediator]|uniref:uncharacterized protein LOC130666383 n=1 Tax=Microplitis mediator TaxID=375433 RepID=UPI00255715AE|nr:uncharacterized protein LOC130666383 [Microplitis mediator]XP_057323312.1 uncharacterized protein LOC130666383 [Microplitis mediator]XP_057323314.1 uncharacterized protein LOC130666383 [Microplitis mediator]XP_057323315.1 uncharacterized protein LOC130666383 [Microplitis mediator]XP_057336336.1 uncharacterized protein LOC130674904 [Microplitis mediator]XP_057336337.1 uncharacterized protein LOC130674904 [Microplitis mediator]XP_057336339.1 uncharacterized protein LOC130674904 [Microplitis 
MLKIKSHVKRLTNFYANFNHSLKNNVSMQNEFKDMIRKAGGRNVQKATRFALESFISDELAKQVTWSGLHSEIKISACFFVEIISEILLSTLNVTKPDVEHQMKAWFQRGSDRANKNTDPTNGSVKKQKVAK